MTHSHRAARALVQLPETDPALGLLALWCRHRDGTAPTHTQGEAVVYGPDFDALTLAEQTGLVAHHVLHVALRHSARSDDLRERLGLEFDPSLYALAADAVVNDTLQLAEFAVPRPYVSLLDLLSRIGKSAPSTREALAEWDVDRLAMLLHRDSEAGRSARAYAQQQAFRKDLEPEQGGADGTQSPADWRGHIARAMAAGRQAGTGIGVLASLIADLAPPRVPWETRLRGLLARALTDRARPSHRRPANRWIAAEAHARLTGQPEPAFEPSMARNNWRGRVVVALDTSSSIDPLTLAMFTAEVDGIASRSGAEVHLLAFDIEVHLEARLTNGLRTAVKDLTLRQGGGTDFRPPLVAAESLRPSAIIVLTDMIGPVGPAPAAPVIWVARAAEGSAPPFGTLVTLPD